MRAPSPTNIVLDSATRLSSAAASTGASLFAFLAVFFDDSLASAVPHAHASAPASNNPRSSRMPLSPAIVRIFGGSTLLFYILQLITDHRSRILRSRLYCQRLLHRRALCHPLV